MEVKSPPLFTVFYSESVVCDDIPKLPAIWKKRIKKAIESKLTVSPETFGKPLRRSLKNYRKLRVGNYRVVFRIEKKTVKIFVIQHRSTVYSIAQKRLPS